MEIQGITLANPLTLEERLQVTRLLSHDVSDYLNELRCGVGVEVPEIFRKRLQAIVNHIDNTQISVANLIHDDSFDIACNYNWCLRNESERTFFIERLRRLFPGNFQKPAGLDYAQTSPGELQVMNCCFDHYFLSYESLLHSVLFNLIKNGLAAQKEGERKVLLQVRILERFPREPNFIPEGARDYDRFVAFDVLNKGRFSSEIPFSQHLTDSSKEGFGLYFVGLAAKVLRAPIIMETGNDSTRICFYHLAFLLYLC
jgi:hypothetical protein